MKLATYNILKGDSNRTHWTKIDDLGVDLLLVQESYPYDDHLPPLLYPDSCNRSVWKMVGQPMVVSSELKAFVEPKLKNKYVHFVNDMDPISRVVKPFQHFGHLVWLKDGKVYRSKPVGLRFGNPAISLEELPSLEPMSFAEFGNFRAKLTKDDESVEPKRAPDGSIIVEGYLPDFDDHKMIHYLNMMDILDGGEQTTQEVFLNE